MGQKKANTNKAYRLTLSPTAVFFWSIAFVVVLAWIFVLGIFVGRGLIPESVQNLVTLRPPVETPEGTDGNKTSSPSELIKPIEKDPKLAFYDVLTSTRKDAPRAPEASPSAGEPVAPRETRPPPPEPESKGRYTVQVASLEDGRKADQLVDRLVTQGYRAYTQKAAIGGKTYYRVRCGRFETRDQAGALQNVLAEKEGLNGFVTSID